MGFRFSKSIQVVPGVRLNFSRRGVGYSVGGKGMRITKHANGRISRTVSVPGTGLSHQQTLRTAPRRTRTARIPASPPRPGIPPTAPVPLASAPPTPAFTAPQWEKDLFAVLHSRTPADYIAVARAHGRAMPTVRLIAAALEGLLHVEHGIGHSGAQGRARELLGWVVAQNEPLATHPFVIRYLADHTWPVEIAFGVTASLRIQDEVLRLAVAELHQQAGDVDAAIWTVEGAPPTTLSALSLAELYSDAGRHQDVVDLTNGVSNLDDATALLLAFRGRAFAHLGYHDAARESFKEALRVRTRSAAVRHRALLERAYVDLAQNRKAAARKGIEKVLAEDPTYPGLTEALAELPPMPNTQPQ
ncbi:DUF4236 domain-containing protein [Rhodococcus sp. PSBB049]|uniref:DUF4236 domain-containing protein n=1 Tax=Rhodococcus sp. PSBB049 TaxID=2812863 RepID=UPI0019803775|nr:DUF4236 domain-containing protein [Rhodococcus sp. PSBB049]QSE72354.1 DUF4236 domain-containing protein [Rhodococcus sp. PSBB049]